MNAAATVPLFPSGTLMLLITRDGVGSLSTMVESLGR